MPQVCDIVLLPFPFTDLSAAKLRPVLVLKAPNAQGDFVAAQVTSQLHHHPSVRLRPGDFELGDLPKASIVRVDKIFTLSEALVVRRVGRLRMNGFQPILDAVCEQLDCGRC